MATRSVSKKSRAARRTRTRTVKIDGLHYPIGRDGLVEVDGHRLSKRQVEQLEGLIADRRRIAEKPGSLIREWDADNYARSVGLQDLLYRYAPRAKAKERLGTLPLELSRTVLSIGSLREFLFFDEGTVGEHGCALLQSLVGDAESQLASLRHFVDSMAMQRSTKLHDWVAREQEFERLGKGVQP